MNILHTLKKKKKLQFTIVKEKHFRNHNERKKCIGRNKNTIKSMNLWHHLFMYGTVNACFQHIALWGYGHVITQLPHKSISVPQV